MKTYTMDITPTVMLDFHAIAGKSPPLDKALMKNDDPPSNIFIPPIPTNND